MIIDMSMVDISLNSDNLGSQAFEKFWQIRRAINLKAGHEFKNLGVGLKQALVVFYLGKRGKVSQADLARETGTDPAAMVRTVAVLLRQGWISQHDHPGDRRRWDLELTPEGKVLEKKVKPVFKRVEQYFYQNLSDLESRTLVALQDKILLAYSRK
jgi:DNA-binding MarR family transcriptional regulator